MGIEMQGWSVFRDAWFNLYTLITRATGVWPQPTVFYQVRGLRTCVLGVITRRARYRGQIWVFRAQI